MFTADAAIREADGDVGIVENPPGSNRTPLGVEYGWNGVPWCAISVSCWLSRVGFPLHTAAVSVLEHLGRIGWQGMGTSPTPVRGSAVVFDWKGAGNPDNFHTGLVYEVVDDGFRTIEGNYRDRVGRWLRDMKYVRTFATFPYETAGPDPAPAPPTPPKEEDMTYVYVVRESETEDGKPDGGVVALFGSGAHVPIHSFADHETIFGVLESELRLYGTSTMIPDSRGDSRPVWVIGHEQYDGMGLPR